MRRLFDLSRYPALVVFLFMAICATVLAWMSFGLLHLAMANAEFLLTYRLMALKDGGLLQTLELAGRGLVALVAYLGLKGCESELITRWRGPKR